MADTATTQADEDVQREVLRELEWNAEVEPNEIAVTVQNGATTLTGRVDTFSKKWAAERAALRVRAVKAVVNDIEVRLAAGNEQTDVDLARSVARTLEADLLVPDDMVKVSVSGGWVTLRGEVDWDYQRQEAQRVVRTSPASRGSATLSPSGRLPALCPTNSRRRSRTPRHGRPRQMRNGSASSPRAAR